VLGQRFSQNVSLTTSHGPEAAEFVCGPHYDAARQVDAGITWRIDPSAEFNFIAKTGRGGSTGETYLINKSWSTDLPIAL